MKRRGWPLPILLSICLMLGGCARQEKTQTLRASGEGWTVGFGRAEITADAETDGLYYIAGYNQGWPAAEVLDQSTAWAVWLETGDASTLLIGVDCIALGSDFVAEIRARVADLGCGAVNVHATHSHAGVDTLGLWGPAGMDGKNQAYMRKLVDACAQAAALARADRKTGSLHWGSVETVKALLKDSRNPQVFDPTLYQLRFAPKDGSAGVRLYLYGAHAESLRSQNRRLSRDFPGVLCDLVEEQTADRAAFMPGAIGGLIMTEEIAWPAVENLKKTGERLAQYALSITPDQEQIVEPRLRCDSTEVIIPLDNAAFMLYQFLGILNRRISSAQSATGYALHTELGVLQLGDLTFALIPGEIFPELVWGGARKSDTPDPPTLSEIAAANGIEHLLVIGLANDEIGYIVPPSDFLVNQDAPYFKRIRDAFGEDHYEETNSVGPQTAAKLAEGLHRLLSGNRNS